MHQRRRRLQRVPLRAQEARKPQAGKEIHAGADADHDEENLVKDVAGVKDIHASGRFRGRGMTERGV